MPLLDTIHDLLPFGEKGASYGVVNPAAKKKPLPKLQIAPWMIAVLVGVVLVAVTLLVAANLLTEMRQKPITLSEQLVARFSNSIDVIDAYSDDLSSSALRTAASSLRESLNSSSTELTNYLTENHGYDSSSASSSSIWAEETTLAEPTMAELENARLNGILDRTFAREMVLLIAEILSIESEIMARTENSSLIAILQTSTSSLTTLSTDFEGMQASLWSPTWGRSSFNLIG